LSPTGFSEKLPGPAVLLNMRQVRDNAQAMFDRAQAAGVSFRPHFKTHQSVEVGACFLELGVEQITVSSWSMAQAFVAAGWRDLTVALPWQPGASEALSQLLGQCSQLGVVVDSEDAVQALLAEVQRWPARHRDGLRVWVKLDAGYGRAGVNWTNQACLESMFRSLHQAGLVAQGLLFHSGHSYDVTGQSAIAALHAECLSRVLPLREQLEAWCADGHCRLSMGDTPTCSLLNEWGPVDEIRPGNFVYYDLSQLEIGSCGVEQIAASVLCPVLSVDAAAGRMLLHGGAVHLSKDRMQDQHGVHFGQLAAKPFRGSWLLPHEGLRLNDLSQEHGKVLGSAELLKHFRCGDLAQVFPVHSCLACDLHRHYWTIEGRQLSRIG